MDKPDNVFTYVLPAHWASALINNDWSGLTHPDGEELAKWLEKEQPGACVDCEHSDPYFKHSNDAGTLACTVLEFYFVKHKQAEPGQHDDPGPKGEPGPAGEEPVQAPIEFTHPETEEAQSNKLEAINDATEALEGESVIFTPHKSYVRTYLLPGSSGDMVRLNLPRHAFVMNLVSDPETLYPAVVCQEHVSGEQNEPRYFLLLADGRIFENQNQYMYIGTVTYAKHTVGSNDRAQGGKYLHVYEKVHLTDEERYG